uniref:Phage protein Gp37/Gp68 n=1 Tax=Candidatus Kentrum sp. LFY TaxID=2126342 RepID=A0A450WC25_9GAMM|nr:MAG: Phage protein Gp37/Gp68 [Candidatus Kentron sp. LFY]
MANRSAIEWTEYTWNPVTGCTKISGGCKHCYAQRMSKRLAGRYGYPPDNPFQVTLHPDKLETPLKLRKPGMIFVCSMGDLFHDDVPFHFIDKVFDTMWRTPWHTYQLLTKRPERMVDYILERAYRRHFGWTNYSRGAIAPGDILSFEQILMRDICGYMDISEGKEWACMHPELGDHRGDEYTCASYECPIAYEIGDRETLEEIGVADEYDFDSDGYVQDATEWMRIQSRPRHAWPGNVWLGFSAENQLAFSKRMPIFRRLRWELPKETILFWSYEPAIGPVDTTIPYYAEDTKPNWSPFERYEFSEGSVQLGVPYLNWIVAGGETGPKARNVEPDWIRSVRDQCIGAEIPFFFKHWGGKNKKKTGRMLDDKTWDGMPITHSKAIKNQKT